MSRNEQSVLHFGICIIIKRTAANKRRADVGPHTCALNQWYQRQERMQPERRPLKSARPRKLRNPDFLEHNNNNHEIIAPALNLRQLDETQETFWWVAFFLREE